MRTATSGSATVHPTIIQGGMGIYISTWFLARTVSMRGALGTVSGAGIWVVLVRVLQNGDPDGHYRRALARFPDQETAKAIVDKYFLENGRGGRAFLEPPMMALELDEGAQEGPLERELENLMVAAAFAEVWLAKEGHLGVIAINLLEKIQLSVLPVLYGAMLAGVDYVLVGAGLPMQIPGALDLLTARRPARYLITVEQAPRGESFAATFDPRRFGASAPLQRPYFFPIISVAVAATVLVRRAGRIDGVIIEGHTAGGHNAGPRRPGRFNADGEPVYDEKDEVNLDQVRALGLNFYLAGAYAGPEKIAEAIALGALGVQVGSIFALCQESGMVTNLKSVAVSLWRQGKLTISSNPKSSPSGYPFEEANIPGTITDPRVKRVPICNIGALRIQYKKADGSLGYRCRAMPLKQFLMEGGTVEEAEGAMCLCNGLFATAGLAQVRPHGFIEPPLVTLGKDLNFLAELSDGYTAGDALDHLLRTPALASFGLPSSG